MKQNISASMPFGDLEALSRQQEQRTHEIFTPNDFYGHASVLKRYCGLEERYALKAVLEHGCALGGKLWSDYVACPLPGMIAFSPSRKKILESQTDKMVEYIGPYIHYAAHALGEKELARERKRLGSSLLVFPLHSSTHITVEYDIHDLCRQIARIGKDFDSMRCCLYWRDVQLGRRHIYESHGFECVCAGHIFDLDFLPRLKSILATASLTVSNGVSTVMGYSVLMDIPHLFLDTMVGLSAEDEETFRREYTPWHNTQLPADCLEVQNAFSERGHAITPRQRDVVDRYWGTHCLRSPGELREIFQRFEDAQAQYKKMAS